MLRMVGEAIFAPIRYFYFTILLIVPHMIFELVLSGNGTATISALNHYITLPDKLGLPMQLAPNLSNLELLLFALSFTFSISMAVRLHQKIILGKCDKLIQFIPGRIEVTYGLYLFALATLIAVIAYATSIVSFLFYTKILPTLWSAPILRDYGLIRNILSLSFLIATGLFVAQILIRVMLSFPRVAINRDMHKWSKTIKRKTLILSSSGRAIILVLALSSIPLITLQLQGEYLQNRPAINSHDWYILGLIICSQLYISITMISIFSVVYRDRVLPYIDKKNEDA